MDGVDDLGAVRGLPRRRLAPCHLRRDHRWDSGRHNSATSHILADPSCTATAARRVDRGGARRREPRPLPLCAKRERPRDEVKWGLPSRPDTSSRRSPGGEPTPACPEGQAGHSVTVPHTRAPRAHAPDVGRVARSPDRATCARARGRRAAGWHRWRGRRSAHTARGGGRSWPPGRPHAVAVAALENRRHQGSA